MLFRYKAQRWLAQYISQYCVLCRQPTETSLCTTCKSSIKSFNHSRFNYNLMRWPKIIEAMRPNTMARLHAFGDYQYPLSYWLKQLKFKQQLIFSEVLADLFAETLASRPDSMPEVLIPAPLHPKRYLHRHYNQARVLAQSIGYRLEIPLLDGTLVRQTDTRAQSHLKRQQRLNNVNSAFRATKITGPVTHIAIVDDVITTGATMQAMISALLKSNPNLNIEVWSIAVALSSLDQVG